MRVVTNKKRAFELAKSGELFWFDDLSKEYRPTDKYGAMVTKQWGRVSFYCLSGI
jgi:hypothetical protein